MNSNFGSSLHSNWGFSSNSELEDKWAQLRREDEKSDEEDEAWHNTTYMAAMVGVMVCDATKRQLQWGGSVTGHSYNLNGRQYNMRYYLAYDIYPKWATLVQTIANPVDDAQMSFTLHQEAYRKDVERAFGILQARWNIIKEPARGWSRDKLNSIMMSCIILHNMIVEDERGGYIDGEFDDNQENPNRSRKAHAKIYDESNLPLDPRTSNISLNEYMRRHRMIRLHATNKYLQQDLIAHLWPKITME